MNKVIKVKIKYFDNADKMFEVDKIFNIDEIYNAVFDDFIFYKVCDNNGNCSVFVIEQLEVIE